MYYTMEIEKIKEDLSNAIGDTIRDSKRYLSRFENSQSIPSPKPLLDIYKIFKRNIERNIPKEKFEKICDRKDNREYQLNPYFLSLRTLRERIFLPYKPIFTNFISGLDELLYELNMDYAEKPYKFSYVLFLDEKPYEIFPIKIIEAYTFMIINKDNPLRKEPPKKNGRYINEFEIHIPAFPKRFGYNKVIIKGYRNQGAFDINTESPSDEYQSLRKIRFGNNWYFPTPLQREGLQALYTMHYLETINAQRNGQYPLYYIIVPDISLVKVFANILTATIFYYSRRSYKELSILSIPTYILLLAEIQKRKEIGLNSFHIQYRTTPGKLDSAYNLIKKQIEYIKRIRKINNYITI